LYLISVSGQDTRQRQIELFWCNSVGAERNWSDENLRPHMALIKAQSLWVRGSEVIFVMGQ